MLVQHIRSTQISTVDKGVKKGEVTKLSEVKKCKGKDTVALSKEGKNILKNGCSNTDRAKRIEDLKRRIDLGEYSIDSQELAKKILKSMRGE